MYVGTPTLCLRVTDLNRAIRFYQTIGFEVIADEGIENQSAFIRRGNFKIMLMHQFGDTSINFRGVDAFKIHGYLQSKDFELKGDNPVQLGKENFWAVYDLDGNGLFFNTREDETTSAHKQKLRNQSLLNTLQDLKDLDASSDCLNDFQDFIAKHIE